MCQLIRPRDTLMAYFWTNTRMASINRGQNSAMPGLRRYNSYGHLRLNYETIERLTAADAVSLFRFWSTEKGIINYDFMLYNLYRPPADAAVIHNL